MNILKLDNCSEAAFMKLSLSKEPTVVIHGRAGCGKTHNAEKLAKTFGLSVVIDEWDGGYLPSTGVLALTDDSSRAGNSGHKVFEFHQAMAFREAKLARDAIDAIA